MKPASRVAAGIAVISSIVLITPPAAQTRVVLDNPQVEIVYAQPRNPAFVQIQERLKQRQVLESLKQFLAPLRLPRKLTVRIDQCDAQVRAFKAGGPATICYELVEMIEKTAAKAAADVREDVVVGAFVQVVLHEVAEAILDILQIPVWGRMEDAADNLAAFIMLQFGDDIARKTIIGTSIFFELSGKTWTGSDFADVNSPEPQRYFNFLCLAYGSDQKTFDFLTKEEKNRPAMLPERRGSRCPAEFEQVRRAFNFRIMPHVDPDLVTEVRSRVWVK